MKKISTIFLMLAMLMHCTPNATAQERILEVIKGGVVDFSIPASDIDYMWITSMLDTPANLQAEPNNNFITITWGEVSGATSYNIFRSRDGYAYALIGSSPTTAYVDVAPLPKANYYRVQAVCEDGNSERSEAIGPFVTSVPTYESGIYLGVMGFNQQVYTHPITHLTLDAQDEYNGFIDRLVMKKGTVLYYSVNEAISTLQAQAYPNDLFNVAIVTFTDGLDWGSSMLDDTYESESEYLNAVHDRILNEKVDGCPINAYSIGLRGNDVVSTADVAQFQLNLKQLASKPENAIEVSSMDEVNEKFKAIAQQLVENNLVQTINLNIPGLPNGTKVRFTFDNISAATDSKLYIEGTFNLRDKSLENVTYYGMTSVSGETVKGAVDGIFVKFTFDGIHTPNNEPINGRYINVWKYTSANSWQINSEFDMDQDSSIETVRKSAAIMLVLDCSSSLGTDFPQIQNNAKDFISTLLQVDPNDPSVNPGGDLGPVLEYSTTPADLALAVTCNGRRYYLTQEEYEENKEEIDAMCLLEGVCVISANESFIVAMKDVSTNTISRSMCTTMYPDRLPSYEQGIVISARWDAINSALKAFGGSELVSGNYYQTNSYYKSSSTTYYRFITRSGGYLSESTDSYGRLRIVIPTSFTPTAPTNDLKLKCVKDKDAKYLTVAEYKANGIPVGYAAQGVYVVTPGTTPFVIELQNKQPEKITREAAFQMYGSYLPTYDEAKIIDARRAEINQALKDFGGAAFGSDYYQTGYSYRYSSTDNYGYIYGYGKYTEESSTYSAYVRGIIR